MGTDESPQAWLRNIRTILLKKDPRTGVDDLERLRAWIEGVEDSLRSVRSQLDAVSQFVGALDLSGRVMDVNRPALEFIGARREEIIGRPFADTPWWSHSKREQQRLREAILAAGQGSPVRFETQHPDRCGKLHQIDFFLKPEIGADGKILFLLAEGRDISDFDQASQQAILQNHLFVALSRLNQAVLHNTDEEVLLQEVCDISASLEEIKLAWVGLSRSGGREPRPVAWAGEAIDALHELAMASQDGLSALVARVLQAEGCLCVDDLRSEGGLEDFHDAFERLGLFSLAIFPLCREETAAGVLVLYADRPGFFQGDIRQLFLEMTANTSYALDNLARERRRKEAEEAMRFSEARYRELVENANSIILRLQPDGIVTFYNEFAERFFGYRREEVIGRPVWKTIVPERDVSGRDLKQLVAEVIRYPERHRNHLNQNRKKSGELVWVAWTNKLVLDEAGAVREILTIGLDVTAQQEQAHLLQRQAREEAVRSKMLHFALEETDLKGFLQQTLQMLQEQHWLEILPKAAVFLLDETGNSLELAAALHFSPEQRESCRVIPLDHCLCGRVARERTPALGQACDLHEGPEGEAGNGHLHHVLPLLVGDELLGVLNLYLPAGHLPNPANEKFLLGLAAVLAVGISRRKTTAALRSHDAMLQQLIDTIPVPVYYKDLRLAYQGCNDCFARDILGLPKEQIVGKSLYDIYPTDIARSIERMDRELLSRKTPTVNHTEVLYADGKRHPVISHKAPLEDEEGKATGIVGVVLDLTEHKRLEEQLRHAQKMEALGTLTGGIAHDFNNLLTAIMGYASILQLKLPPDDHLTAIAGHILDTVDRASNLTYSLLTYSRKKVANPQPVDLNELVSGVERILERILRENIELRVATTALPLPVLADTPQLEQVVINLVTNARDAMRKGGVLTVTTRVLDVDQGQVIAQGMRPGPYAELTVGDTGSGIPEEIRQRIFDPFFTTKEVGRGTGLGLSISYSIVQQHGGVILVDSAEGEGTTMRVCLPLAGSKVAEKFVEPRRSFGPSGRETLLLVEDDQGVRGATKALLEECGYTVLDAETANQALELFAKNRERIQLVLSDIIMPGTNGVDLSRQLQELQPGLPVLLTSGYTFDALEEQGIHREELQILYKPVSPYELLQRVREALDGTEVDPGV